MTSPWQGHKQHCSPVLADPHDLPFFPFSVVTAPGIFSHSQRPAQHGWLFVYVSYYKGTLGAFGVRLVSGWCPVAARNQLGIGARSDSFLTRSILVYAPLYTFYSFAVALYY